MAEDPCTYHRPSTECGKYPKCSIKNGGGKLFFTPTTIALINININININIDFVFICINKNTGASCRTTQCPLGKYCKTVDGQPTCADTSSQLGESFNLSKKIYIF